MRLIQITLVSSFDSRRFHLGRTDNVDAFSNSAGIRGLSQTDSVIFIQKLAAEARRYGLSTGLKNTEQILSAVQNDIQFAINEGCQTSGDCKVYGQFLASGKPVFHIEYADVVTTSNGQVTVSSNAAGLGGRNPEEIRQVLCLERDTTGANYDPGAPAAAFSTIIKTKRLDGYAFYCDGSFTLTPTMNVPAGGPQSGLCDNT
jgi:hypothetical protein